MMFKDFITTLAIAHYQRTGYLPAGPWRQWLWQPWVRDVLFAFDPPRPRLAVARREP